MRGGSQRVPAPPAPQSSPATRIYSSIPEEAPSRVQDALRTGSGRQQIVCGWCVIYLPGKARLCGSIWFPACFQAHILAHAPSGPDETRAQGVGGGAVVLGPTLPSSAALGMGTSPGWGSATRTGEGRGKPQGPCPTAQQGPTGLCRGWALGCRTAESPGTSPNQLLSASRGPGQRGPRNLLPKAPPASPAATPPVGLL